MQYISKETIDNIKMQNDIVDVISSYISVNNKLKAICPFHNDHNASLSIQKDKQMFMCFSCGAAGDVFTFVKRIEGISYFEAVAKLAHNVGIEINVKKSVNESLKKYYDINELTTSFYKNNLMSNKGKNALKYLSDRSIDETIIKKFNIGLSSNGNTISKLLVSKGYSEEDILKIDISKEYGTDLVDSFQDRIVFPIIDENDNILGFSGRKYSKSDLENDSVPKYYNTRETNIFIKGNTFYNINNAFEEIKRKKEMIITEGQMDAIRVYSIGHFNTVALMGKSLTKEQINKIISYKCKVILNLDSDNAGVLGTLSIGEELIKNNVEVYVITFGDYKDSDEFILNKGKDAYDMLYNNKIPFIDFKLKYLRDNNNLNTSVDKSEYINKAISAINLINDDILRELKIKELCDEFGINDSVIRSKIGNNNIKSENKEETIKHKYNKYDLSELRILYLMLNYDEVITIFENRIGYLINEDRNLLASKIVLYRNNYGEFDYGDFINKNDEEIINNVLKEVNMCYNNETYTEEEIDSYIKNIKEYSIKKVKRQLERQMNESLDINKKIEIAKKIKNIKKEVLEW